MKKLKKSIVIYAAKILLGDVIWKYTYKLFMKKTLNSNVMNVAKILLKPSTYKLFMKRNKIQFKFSTFTQNFGL